MSSEMYNGKKKMNQALHVLNVAARDKKEEIQELLSERLTQGRKNIYRNIKRAKHFVGDALEEGQGKIKKNPWPYMGWGAAAAFLSGFVLGSKNRE